MSEPTIIANWCYAIEGLQASSQEFYHQVAEAIRKRSIPDCEMTKVTLNEGGVFSSNREYLRVRRQELLFDICGAPFGNSFFVSWWLVDTEGTGCLASLPGIGTIMKLFIRPLTYFRLDTAAMFRALTHNSVLEVIDQMTKANGIRSLTELERKPVLKEFYQRFKGA